MEPTQQDLAAVQAAMGGNQQQPAQQPAEQPTQQPTQPTQAPSQQEPAQPQQQPTESPQQTTPSQQPKGDPFESLFADTEPAQETQQQQAPAQQPTEQPSEPGQTQQPTQQQQAPAQAPAKEQPKDDYQTFEEYMNEVTKGVGKEPDMPDASKISPDDPNAIKNFFDDIVNTAVQRAEQGVARKQAIQQAENKAWNQAFEKYGSLKTNKNLRDMVHNIRMGHFNRGEAISPIQAADKLLDAMSKQYKKGVADNQVSTKIEQTQPNAGGSAQPVATSADADKVLKSVQSGGEAALVDYLDSEIKSGKM